MKSFTFEELLHMDARDSVCLEFQRVQDHLFDI